MKFIQIFNVHFLVKDNDPDSDGYESDNDPEVENFIMGFINRSNINVNKTFKIDKCVVCMEAKPNVLFCECGNICLCVSCLNQIKSIYKCPLCNHTNTKIRIL